MRLHTKGNSPKKFNACCPPGRNMKLVQRWPIFAAFEEMGYDVASHVCCLGFYNPDNSMFLRGHSGLHPDNLSGCVKYEKTFRAVCTQVSFSLGLRRGHFTKLNNRPRQLPPKPNFTGVPHSMSCCPGTQTPRFRVPARSLAAGYWVFGVGCWVKVLVGVLLLSIDAVIV